jgi:hypothetical protein
MAEIRVELRDFTDGILGNLDITSSDDFPLSLTYQNFDIRDFNSRNGSFSKTFKVPATKNNNKLFNHIYKDGNVDIKKIRKDIPACIYSDNLPIMYGTLRMSKINKQKDVLEYDCIFLGDNMDWANGLKSLELKDMKFSSSPYSDYLSLLNGTITPTYHTFVNVQDVTQHPSFDTDYVKNQDKIIYPLLSVGEGVSPKDHVTDLEFVPCVYLKNIWDKIFQGQGYEVNSEFCDSQFFKSLIIPLEFEKNGEQVNLRNGKIEKNDSPEQISSYYANQPQSEVESRAVGNPTINKRNGNVVGGTSIDVPNVNITTAQYARYAFYGNDFVDPADINPNVSSSYQGNVRTNNSGLGSSMVVVNNSGLHELTWNVDVEVGSASFNANILDETVEIKIHAEVWKTNLTDDSSDLYYDDVEEALTRTTGSRLIWKSDTRTHNIDEDDDVKIFEENFSGDFTTIPTNTSESYLFVVVPRLTDYAGGNAGSMITKYIGGTFEITGASQFSVGEEIPEIQYMLPDGKQSDFVAGVSQMFNLQFKTDSAAKIVSVEPYDYFYSFNNAYDWTDKIDYSKNTSEDFIYDIKSKIIFKYKDASNDAFLERYNKRNDVDWGAYKEINTTGEFLEGEFIVENKYFSPSFNWYEPDYIDDTSSSFSVTNTPLIPIYHKDFSNINNNAPSAERAEKSYAIGSRILLLNPPNQYMSTANKTKNVGQNGSWQRYHQATNNDLSAESTNKFLFTKAAFINLSASDYDETTTYRTRKYLSMGTYNGSEVFIDNNLSFSDVSQKLYLKDAGGATNSTIIQKGLFSNFYSKMIKQLKQKPRIKVVYINLSYSDVCNIDFSKLVVIDGVYHRINKIVDFQPHKKESTRVELVDYYNLGYDAETVGNVMDLVNDINL